VGETDPRTSTECRGHTGEIQVVKWNPVHNERLVTCASGESFVSLSLGNLESIVCKEAAGVERKKGRAKEEKEADLLENCSVSQVRIKHCTSG